MMCTGSEPGASCLTASRVAVSGFAPLTAASYRRPSTSRGGGSTCGVCHGNPWLARLGRFGSVKMPY